MTLSFAQDIQKLFLPFDRDQMRFAFDLWHHADVRANAEMIYNVWKSAICRAIGHGRRNRLRCSGPGSKRTARPDLTVMAELDPMGIGIRGGTEQTSVVFGCVTILSICE